MATVRFSIQPRSRSRCTKASVDALSNVALFAPRNPTVGSRACCARAASGHAAAPPSSVMSERRFTAGSFRAFDRKVSTPQLRHETAALRDFDRAFVRFGAVATFIRSPPRAQASTVTGEPEHRRSFALHRTIACVIFVCVSSPLQLTISERWYSLRHVRRYDLG